MRHKQIRFVVLLGAISIIGIISVQAYFLQKAWNIREKQFFQTIEIGLKNVAEKISRLNVTTLPYGNPVRQLSSNYFVVDLNSIIDANILEFYLKKEFEKLNLHTDYEYAIYDCHTDKMVYGDYISNNGTSKSPKLTGNLPKYSGYLYYFGIRFPSLRSAVAEDMAIWFFFTVILLLSVIFFVYAIFIILQQKRFSEMQKDFINTMTHEFKTPISSISISADILVHPDIVNDPKRLSRYGWIIKQETQRLNFLVEKLLQIASLEKNRIQLKKERIALNELIRTLSDNFMANHGSSAKIEVSLDDAVDKVEADILHLSSILYNMTDNALKYAGDNPLVQIMTRKENDVALIIVSDNGPGIDPRYRRRVFEKFFRIPSGNIHDVKGFGLGLYYVKIICRAHGWKIRLGSEPGKGAVFTLEIPLNP